MIEFIGSAPPGYVYPALFIGLVFLGGFVLMPAIFMTIVGTINLWYLFAAMLLASLASDAFWYFIGTTTKKEKLYSLRFVQKRMKEAEKFSSFYAKHGIILVFLTKFVYGTRIASHVLAGMHKLSFVWFSIATTLGSAIWFWVLYYLVKGVNASLDSVKSTALRIQLLLLAIVAFTLLFNWFTGTYLRKKLMARKQS